MGSRYDLVERNNNIVLEYRKKEVIRLRLVDLITGYAGEQKALGVSVNSKYALKHIDWDTRALTTMGGCDPSCLAGVRAEQLHRELCSCQYER